MAPSAGRASHLPSRSEVTPLAKTTVKIHGMDKLLKKLHELPDKLEKKVYRQALRAGLKEILPEVKERAPVDSGLLKSLIRIKAGKRKRGLILLDIAVSIGKAFYGRMVEYGHKQKGMFKGEV